MSYFSEERGAELRAIFFESAKEQIQALNEEALKLEKTPGDQEIVRGIRRTVHTLKGDSAACGFRELSDLAHELEDALTPEAAAAAGASLPELVLSAADVLESMIAAYRGRLQPPSPEPLRNLLRRLLRSPKARSAAAQSDARAVRHRFLWSEYEQLAISQAAAREGRVYNIAVEIDPHCAMPEAALQLVCKVLQEAGEVLAMHPDAGSPEGRTVVEAAVASRQTPEWIAQKCQIPAIAGRVTVELTPAAAPRATISPAGSGRLESAAAPAGAAAAEEAEAGKSGTASAPENVLRVDAQRIDDMLNLLGELIIGKSMLQQAVGEFSRRFPKDALRGRLADAMAFQTRVLGDLQRSAMKVRMVPVEQLFRRLPRIVRDTGKQCGKQVALMLTGQDTDLDKSILDALAEPLIHLLRNAVDHGIESPEERQQAGKAPQGTIRISAYHQGSQVVIEVGDDGRGIDTQKIRTAAVSRGLVSAEEASRLSEDEALQLIFRPGFSTAEKVTDVSGRGVGMDVVQEVLRRLKGTVSIETRPGQGATFLLKVPLTLAIIKALLFRVEERLYAAPLSAVLEITRAAESELHRVDRHEVFQLRNEVLTLARLGRAARPAPSGKPPRSFVVVITVGGRKFGLLVDKLAGEEELVIKALDDQVVTSDLVSGASILGDGRVVLILNLAAVVERLGRMQAGQAGTGTAGLLACAAGPGGAPGGAGA